MFTVTYSNLWRLDNSNSGCWVIFIIIMQDKNKGSIDILQHDESDATHTVAPITKGHKKVKNQQLPSAHTHTIIYLLVLES